MGPIPSDDGDTRYFLDFYICSYTPTLSALIQSRNGDSGLPSTELPSILLVAQLFHLWGARSKSSRLSIPR
ncbi:hypothetical protein EI94DRAFT_1735288 [Lactarius quietus]|nr:hypothetical protein EI94DRAFT_1735288 [Lactarius quietus]